MKKTLFLILLSFLFLMCCCSSDDATDSATNVQLSVVPAELIFTYAAGSEQLEVTSNAEWGVSSDQTWCKVSPSGGVSGQATVTVTVEANTTEELRTSTLTFKSGSYSQKYTITQNYEVELVTISDEAFKSYCVQNYDTDKDGEISEREAAVVTSLDVSSKMISSMEGVEKFTALTSINCSNNSISSLDVSALVSLTSLNCAQNKLETLNIQNNINLTSLDCTNNSLLTIIRVWTGFKATSSFLKPDVAEYVEPEIDTPAGYTLVWQDEFNDSRLSGGKPALPNTSDWWYETGDGGWGNNELENYISAFSGTDTCAVVTDGTLKIIAKKVGSQVLSIRMNTSQSWTYGYFEARLKLPQGKGTWPAFWMMPKNFVSWPDDGEIDIMEEVGYRPNYVSSSIHCKSYYHSIGTQKTAEKYVATAESDFHVYAVEWTEDYIWGFVDGESYFKFPNDKAGNKDTWPFNTPFYLKLNLAWGGNWGGAQGVDESKLPATYEIDYVRVFQKQ